MKSIDVLKGLKNKVGVRIKNILKTFDKNILVYSESPSIARYRDLAPVDSSDMNAEYFTALDWAFNNEKVKNIAIAGPYGSGKSSVISSYIKMHPELRYINISLADFLTYDDEGKEVLGQYSESDLEVGILKQLFYRVNHKRIPQSRYRKLHTVSKIKIFISLLLLCFLCRLVSAFVFCNIGVFVENCISKAADNFKCSEGTAYLLLLFTALLLIVCVTQIIWFFITKVHVKEINIADATTATTEKTQDESIFNKNMDEIVYFFEATGYNVVFIEDLDRFNSIDIFIKLRELNTILNSYEEIKKRIVFVYAVRDNMFTQEDRTKFFEFILPVIPIINSTNSGEILSKRIKEDQEMFGDIDLDDEYVEMVSPYISDRRVLDNIYNEFITYKKTLQKVNNANSKKLNLKDKKMMSLIIFKNLYPKDFADLQAEKGIVKQAFQAKKEFVEKKRKELEEKRKSILESIEWAEKDILKNQCEVKLAMMYFMTKGQGQIRYVQINGGSYYFYDLMADNFDLEVLRNRGTVYYTYKGGNNSCAFDGSKEFVGKNDYINRCKIVKLKSIQEKTRLQKQIEEINNEIVRLGTMSLKELIDTFEINEILSEEIRENRLLKFMLRYGFIDERYSDYINHFHENSITRDDMNFILSIRDNEPLAFSHSLSQVTQVIRKLRPEDFAQKDILNFDLADELLRTDDFIEKRNCLFRQLADDSEKSKKFIDEYLDKSTNPKKFISLLVAFWGDLWNWIYSEISISEERKEKYLCYICEAENIEDIVDQDYIGNIERYFVEKPDILTCLYSVSADRVIEIIDRCGIVFKELSRGACNEEVLDWIFENGYYEINIKMLQCIFHRYKPEVEKKLFTRNYTEIMELGYTPLIEKLEEKVSEEDEASSYGTYVDKVFLALEQNTEETLEAVLDLIAKDISTEQAQKIVQKEQVILDDLERCDSKRWDCWLKNRKLQVSWDNLILYWENFGMTSALVEFIEYAIDELVSIGCPSDIDPAMVDDVMQSEMASNCFEYFMTCIPQIESNISLDLIKESNMKVLIQMHYFVFDANFAQNLRIAHPALYVFALVRNLDSVSKDLEHYFIDKNDVEQIVTDTEPSDLKKVEIIKAKLTGPYSMKVALYLSDVNVRLDKVLFKNTWDILPEEKKLGFLINQIPILDGESISKCFTELGGEYKKLSDRERRHDEKLHDNIGNRRLAEQLQKVDYITSYEIENRHRGKESLIRCRIKKRT